MKLGILKTGRPPRACIPRFGTYPEMFQALLGGAHDYSVFAADEGELPESPTACDAWLITGGRPAPTTPTPGLARRWTSCVRRAGRPRWSGCASATS